MHRPHTYFYAHIPEQERKWEQELIEEGIKSCIRHIDYLTDPSCRDKIQRDWEDDLEEGKVFQSRGFIDVDDAEETWYTELFKCTTLDDYIALQLAAPESLLKELRSDQLDVVSLAERRYDLYSSVFGDFIVVDGHIYRDTMHDRSDTPGVKDPVCPKGFRDIFRVPKYYAKDCYSLEDSINRIDEFNLSLTEHQVEELREFWDRYPFGAIVFK